MSAGFWEKMSNIAANSKPAQPLSSEPYGFTEIIHITWPSAVDLQNVSSTASQLWTQITQTFLDHSDTTRVWWGQLVDSPQVIKLIVDWKSIDGRDASQAHQTMTSILEGSPNPITASAPECYLFPTMQGYRQNAFQPPNNYFKDAVTVFTTFFFAEDWDQDELEQEDKLGRPKKFVWDNAWSIFRQAALTSEGAWIADKSLQGWSVDVRPSMHADPKDGQKSFVGVFRFQDAGTARKFANSLQDQEPVQLGSGLAELRRLAERGLKVEAVNMRYESPWIGQN